MMKTLDDAFFADDTFFFDEDSGNATFSSDEMDILSLDLSNINLLDVNFEKDNPETVIHVRSMALCNRFKQRKAFNKETKN